jgi:tetratricopeptide (TPR) repeat protein
MEGRDLATAESHLHEAVQALRQAGSEGDLCAALFELGNIAAQRGDLRGALDFYAEAAHTAEEGHIHYYLALARNNYAYHSLLLGQVEAAEEAAIQGVKVAETYDLLAALLHLYSTRGEIHLYRAEWTLAEESFQRGLAIAEDLGSQERKAGYRGGLALAARGQGNLPEAVRLLKEALLRISESVYWHLYTRLQIWLAETFFRQNSLEDASAALERALSIAREHHRTLLLVQAETLRANILAARGDWKAAESLFCETLDQAKELALPLETARVQAAWGKASRQYSPEPFGAEVLLRTARLTFEAFHAQADLDMLP